jgi:hypothetical protein
LNRKSEYKDINKWRKTCYRQRLKYYRKTANAENRGKRWTDEEIEMIMLHKMTDTAISKIIGRSVEAIQIKRCMVNKKRSVKDGGSQMDKNYHRCV